jgi:hypothetical protein
MPILSLPLNTLGPLTHFATVDVLIAVRPSRAGQLRRAGRPVPSPVEAVAMLDTGASFTLVDTPLLTALGLTTAVNSQQIVVGSGPSFSCDEFNVSFTIVHPKSGPRQNLVLPNVPVLSAAISNLGVGVVIGCDILRNCLLSYDGPGGRFVLAY